VRWHGVAVQPTSGDPPARADPEEGKAGFEARTGEVPHGWQRDHDENTERDAGVASQACPPAAGAQYRQCDARAGQDNAEQYRDPGTFKEPQRNSGDDENNNPHRAGGCLDAFTGVEHRSVAVQHIVNDAQVDIAVV
jgi:hypothetical protein